MSQVSIRPFNPKTDEGAIYSSWPNGAFYSPFVPIQTKKKEWMQTYIAYVKGLLSSSKVLMACISEDPNTILGFCVISGTCLEWISVKWEYREQKIATLLLKDQLIKSVNKDNLTKVGMAILLKHPELDEGEVDGETETKPAIN